MKTFFKKVVFLIEKEAKEALAPLFNDDESVIHWVAAGEEAGDGVQS
ncbi:MAG: hypothetical protein WCP39_07280 [Chlamydiota bacterium]